MTLSINNLTVKVGDKEILHGINLSLKKGEVVALMGPNGSGKSTLANTIMGHPNNKVVTGKILVDEEDITDLPVDKRAQKGIFLSFQYPSEIEGVTVASFLRTAYIANTGKKVNVIEFYKILYKNMDDLKMDHSFAKRYVNVGFSGGEKKRLEALQLKLLHPTYALLDETDSGLDVDALRIIAESIDAIRGSDMGILVITHYTRILEYLKPDRVLIMKDGKIIQQGGPGLSEKIEKEGYEQLEVMT